MRQPRIALEATAVCRARRTGIAQYALNLMAELGTGSPDLRYEHYYRLSRAWKKGSGRAPAHGVRRRWFQDPVWPIFKDLDLIHGLDAKVPNWRGVKSIATVHDLWLWIEAQESGAPEPSMAAGTRRLATTCDAIVAVSEATRQDFLARVDYPEDRVHVCHHGVDPRFRPRIPEQQSAWCAERGLDRPFVLYVGDEVGRKNLPRLFDAWRESPARADFDFVIAGPVRAETLAGVPAVKRLGYVSDEDLEWLYASCAAFLYPTLYEGFGLPIIEAMASGAGVLTSNTGASPEVAGGHAVTVDALQVDAIRDGIDRVLALSSEQLVAAREHTARFTWARCARETAAVHKLTLDRDPLHTAS